MLRLSHDTFHTGQMISSVRATATPADVDAYRTTPLFAVSLPKLAVMSVCTFGIYELYWCHKHWASERARERENLSPFWRAFFAPLWGFSLFPRIQRLTALHGVPATWSGTALALGFLFLNVLWRLPDPYWLLTLFTVVPLMFVQHSVNRLNAVVAPDAPRNDKYSGLNVLMIVIGGLLVLLAVLGAVLPPLPDDPAEQPVVAYHTSAAGGPAPAVVCDPAWLPISRPPEAAYFLATPTGGRPTAVVVQVHAGKLASGTPLTSGPAVLVPWAYGPDCSAVSWNSTTGWVLPVGRAVFTGVPRPRSQWTDRRPTFDIAMAWAQPLWQANDPRWPAGSREALLTPEEFLELYEQLPTHDELRADPSRAAARTAAWAAAHPNVASREPAKTILANLGRAARQ